MEISMTVSPKANFDLPTEIGPLVEQTITACVAESEDACFEAGMAAQAVVADFEKQVAVVQADLKEVTGKLVSATLQNIDTAFRYAHQLAQAKNFPEYFQIQLEFITTQSRDVMGQTAELSRSLAKAAIDS
jgi:hypothetical protein